MVRAFPFSTTRIEPYALVLVLLQPSFSIVFSWKRTRNRGNSTTPELPEWGPRIFIHLGIVTVTAYVLRSVSQSRLKNELCPAPKPANNISKNSGWQVRPCVHFVVVYAVSDFTSFKPIIRNKLTQTALLLQEQTSVCLVIYNLTGSKTHMDSTYCCDW